MHKIITIKAIHYLLRIVFMIICNREDFGSVCFLLGRRKCERVIKGYSGLQARNSQPTEGEVDEEEEAGGEERQGRRHYLGI